MKIKDMDYETFHALVEEELGLLIEIACKTSKSGEIEKLIRSIFERDQNYGDRTVVARIKTALEQLRADAEAITVSGILIGARDKKGTNQPTRLALVGKGRKNIEIVNWEGDTIEQAGKKFIIPVPCAAEIKIGKDPKDKYDNYHLRAIIKHKKKTQDELVADLVKMESIIDVDDIQTPPKGHYPLIVTKVKINMIYPNNVSFENKEKAPVLILDDAKTPKDAPNFCIVAYTTDKKVGCRIYLEARKFGHGTWMVEDMMELATEAVKDYDNPEDQARFLSTALKDREILVVGTVTSRNATTGNQYADFNVNMSAFALIDVPRETPIPTVKMGQQQIEPPACSPEVKVETPTEVPQTTEVPQAAPAEPTVYEEIKKKMLFRAGIITGKKTDPEIKKALRKIDKTSIMTTLMEKNAYPEALVSQVYDDLTAEVKE